MKYVLTMFKTNLIGGMQYRAAAWAGIATQFFWGFMYIMIFEAFYASTSSPMPMTFEQYCTYVWLQQAFLSIIMIWQRDSALFNIITSGDAAYQLCRPQNIYAMWYARLAGGSLSRAALRFAPVLILSLLLPKPYRLMMPTSGLQLALFFAAIALAWLLNTAILMTAYIMTFKTMSAAGSIAVISVLSDFFSGSLIPIPYMPKGLQAVAYALPFRYTADLPFRIYNGSIPIDSAVRELIISVLWTAIIIAAGMFWMNRVTKKLVIQGG